MSTEYIKTSWQDGDIITADKMNNIENGIKGVEEVATSLKEDYTTIFDSAYVTDTASGSIASFPDGADGVPVKSITVDIEPVQSGSGDPSPTNIRPISGHTSAMVTRTGKNLLDPSKITIPASVALVDGVFVAQPISQGTQIITLKFSDAAFAGTPISISFDVWGDGITEFRLDGQPDALYVAGTDFGDKTVNVSTSKQHLTFSGTFLAGTTSFRIFRTPSFSGAGTVTANISNIRIEYGSATAYEPYNGNTYEIDLDGTRYGGSLDVGTGVLTVDRGYVTLNGSESNTWNLGSDSTRQTVYAGPTLLPNVKTTGGYQQNAVCNAFNIIGSSSQRAVGCAYIDNGYFNMVFALNTFSTSNDVKTWLSSNNVQLVYELATPTTVQLSANELKTVLGQNNIWNDCGNTEVEYRADTKLYIEKLTAPTEDDMIADHAISANAFFMVGNTLYRATTAIASGATITVGTNATKMSLSEALNTLS